MVGYANDLWDTVQIVHALKMRLVLHACSGLDMRGSTILGAW